MGRYHRIEDDARDEGRQDATHALLRLLRVGEVIAGTGFDTGRLTWRAKIGERVYVVTSEDIVALDIGARSAMRERGD